MAFTMMGTKGTIRHRIHPKKVKGPSGYKGPQKSKLMIALKGAERTHTVAPGARLPKQTFFGKVKSFFARGNR